MQNLVLSLVVMASGPRRWPCFPPLYSDFRALLCHAELIASPLWMPLFRSPPAWSLVFLMSEVVTATTDLSWKLIIHVSEIPPVLLGIPWPALRGPLRNHFWKKGVPSRTGVERILEMLWKPQMPLIIGLGGSQPYSRGEFQEALWERFRGLSGILPEFLPESPQCSECARIARFFFNFRLCISSAGRKWLIAAISETHSNKKGCDLRVRISVASDEIWFCELRGKITFFLGSFLADLALAKEICCDCVLRFDAL